MNASNHRGGPVSLHADRFSSLLEQAGAGERPSSLDVPQRWGDLNGWPQGAWRAFEPELAAALSGATGGLESAALEASVMAVDVAGPIGIDV